MKIRHNISAIFTLTSCVVGAGFVSGRELIMLLGNSNTICNAVIFGCLYSIAIYATMQYCCQNNIHSTLQLSQHVAGRAYPVISALLLVCYLTMSVTMLATINDTMNYALGHANNMSIYSFAVAIAVAIFLFNGAKGLRLLCNLSMPMILVIMLICLICNHDTLQYTGGLPNSSQCVKYMLFNSIMSLAILIPLSHNTSKAIVSIGVGSLLCMLIVVILALMDYYPINSYSLPILQLANNSWQMILYVVCILISATISVATNSYALITWLNDTVDNRLLSVSIVMTISVLLSLFGLDIILPFMYPTVSAIALILLLLCIAKPKKTAIL